ncbi:unnamed protein product, partial [marine sediment metagenome]
PYAIIEAFQAKQAIPYLDEAIQAAMNRSARSVAMKIGKTYVTTLGKEVGGELIQEVIQIGAEDIAQEMGGAGLDVDAIYIQQRMYRMLTTAKESAKAMALLPAPGAAWNVGVEMAVNQNLMEEDAANSMKREGYRQEVTTEDQIAELDEDQRDAISGIVEDLGLSLGEAVEMLQNFNHNEFQLQSMDDRVVKHNVEDAIDAVDVVEDGTEIQGLADHSKLKKAFKKGSEFVHNYGIRHARIRNIIKSLDGEENGV